MKTVITTDVERASRLMSEFPGVVFDLRRSENCHAPQVKAGKYVSLLERSSLPFLGGILRAVKRLGYPVYVIGEEGEWEGILEQAGMLAMGFLAEEVGEGEPAESD